MLPLGTLVLAWPQWSPERRQTWARRVAQETIRRVVPLALRAAAKVHPDESHRAALESAAAKCADERSESAAESAESARSAAESAASAGDEPLRLIATIMAEAVEATEPVAVPS